MVNEMMCVTDDICGTIRRMMVVAMNTSVSGRFHQSLLKDGVRSPMVANRMFDMPIIGRVEQKKTTVPMRNEMTNCRMFSFALRLGVLLYTSQNDKQLADR